MTRGRSCSFTEYGKLLGKTQRIHRGLEVSSIIIVIRDYPRLITGSGSFYEQSCRCLGDQLDAARALASQIADRSDIRYGMACVTTFGDFAEHAPHEL